MSRALWPISERLYNLQGERYRDSGDIDGDHYWGPSKPDEFKTIDQWASEGRVVVPGKRCADA